MYRQKTGWLSYTVGKTEAWCLKVQDTPTDLGKWKQAFEIKFLIHRAMVNFEADAPLRGPEERTNRELVCLTEAVGFRYTLN